MLLILILWCGLFTLTVLRILDEVASVGSNHPNINTAKHLACIIRENPEVVMPNRRHIVAGALVEKDLSGLPNVISAFHLDTEVKRESFLAHYVRVFLDCFIPPMLKGLAFEAHGQNVLLRLTMQGELEGFTVRDFGGVMYHPETVLGETGVSVSLLEGSSIEANSMDDVYRVFFHAGIQSHLHRLIRALGMHHNRRGWEMVRENLQRLLEGHPLLDQWLKPLVPSKSLLCMKLGGLYRDVSCTCLFLCLFFCFSPFEDLGFFFFFFFF